MANYCNFWSTIILKESSIVKDAKTVKVFAVSKDTSTSAKKTTSLEVYPDDKNTELNTQC